MFLYVLYLYVIPATIQRMHKRYKIFYNLDKAILPDCCLPNKCFTCFYRVQQSSLLSYANAVSGLAALSVRGCLQNRCIFQFNRSPRNASNTNNKRIIEGIIGGNIAQRNYATKLNCSLLMAIATYGDIAVQPQHDHCILQSSCDHLKIISTIMKRS